MIALKQYSNQNASHATEAHTHKTWQTNGKTIVQEGKTAQHRIPAKENIDVVEIDAGPDSIDGSMAEQKI